MRAALGIAGSLALVAALAIAPGSIDAAQADPQPFGQVHIQFPCLDGVCLAHSDDPKGMIEANHVLAQQVADLKTELAVAGKKCATTIVIPPDASRRGA